MEEEDEEHRLLVALGRITEFGTGMEWMLRLGFCCLVGSKYAAVVAGGQSANWLIEQCRALTLVNDEITAENKTTLLSALSACKSVSQQRNALIHGEKAPVGDGRIITFLSRSNKHLALRTSWTIESIEAVSHKIEDASYALEKAIEDSLSVDVLEFAEDLGQALPRT